MAMNVGSGNPNADPEELIDINTTPLIDVMLVLLVMLIITIPVQTHSVKLDMPDPNAPPPPEETTPPPVVELVIDFDGTIYWNDSVVSAPGELEQRFRWAAQQDPQPEFHIRPNALVDYKYVAHVLAAAQRLGVTQIGLVGNEQFM